MERRPHSLLQERGLQCVPAPQITDPALTGCSPRGHWQFGVVCHLLRSPAALIPSQARRLLVTTHPCWPHRRGLRGLRTRGREGTECRRVTGTRGHHARKMTAQPGRQCGAPLSPSSPPENTEKPKHTKRPRHRLRHLLWFLFSTGGGAATAAAAPPPLQTCRAGPLASQRAGSRFQAPPTPSNRPFPPIS